MLKCPLRLVWCVPSMMTHASPSWRTHELETLLHHVTSWMTIPVCLMSFTSTSHFKVAPVLSQLWWRASSVLMYGQSMGPLRFTLCGPWSFAPRQVQTCFPYWANFCREKHFQATTKTILWSVLWKVISSLIAKSRLMMIELQDLSLWETSNKRAQLATDPHKKNIMTCMLSSDILPHI